MKRIDLLNEMLEKDRHDPFLHYALAMEFMSLNKVDSAIEKLKYLLHYQQNYLASYYQLGKCLEKKGETQEAINVYKNGIKLAQQQNETKAYNELKEALAMIAEF